MKTKGRLPSRDVVALAKKTISDQAAVPESPAVFRADGGIELCTAAAIAHAGYALVSPERARSFAIRSAQTGSKALIADAFCELGWTRRLAHSVLSKNDGVDSRERKAWSVAFLSDLEERCSSSGCS
jgi:hypothetical protein